MAAAITLGVSSAPAADVIKANNATALNDPLSWTTSPAPGIGDVAVWNSTVTAANTVNLGSDLSLGGIRVANPGGAVTVRHAAGQTLTLGSSGIDLSSATANLTLLSAATANTAVNLAVSANQTWSLASGRTLTLFSTSNSANQRLTGSGNLRVTGPGTVTMLVGDLGSTSFDSGNGNDTYSGNWTIDGGAKVQSLRNGTHAWGRGAITLDNGTIAQRDGNWSWSNAISLSAGGGTVFNDSSGTGRYLNLTGVISGSGALAFGSATAMSTNEGFILTGTNTFTGPMSIAANATVRIGGDATTSTNSNAAGALGSISGSVAITNNGILGFGRTDAHTFANAISGSGVVRLGRAGGVLPATQVVTLSGASTYTGATQVNAGRLNLTGSLTSAITVASGASISGAGSTTGLLTLSSGGAMALSGGAVTSGLTANGVTFGGSNLASFLEAPVAGTTYTLVNYGAGAVTNPNNLTVGWRGSVVDDIANRRLTFTAGASGTRTWNTSVPTGTWSQGVAGRFVEGDLAFYGGDAVVFNDPGAAAAVTLSGRLAPSSVTVNNSVNAYTFSGVDGVSDITGSASLAKQGSGTLVVTTAQTYSGGTSLQAGTVQLTGTGSLGSGAVAISSGAVLQLAGSLAAGSLGLSAGSLVELSRTADTTYSLVFSGAGRVSKVAANRYTISGANGSAAIDWYFNTVDPIGGGLGFASSAAVGGAGSSFTVEPGKAGSAFFNVTGQSTAATISIGAGGTFTWNGSTGHTGTLSGVISGAGAFAKVSGATARLTGDNTHTGSISISGGGILEVADSGRLASGDVTSTVAISGGRLHVATTANQVISGIVSGGGRLDKSNTGDLTLSAENTYSGGTEVLGGRLLVTAASGLGSGYLAIKSGGVLVYGGAGEETVARNLFLDSGAARIEVTNAGGSLIWNDASAKTGALTKAGSGSLSLGGALTGGASVTVDGGVLRLRGANTFSGAITVTSGRLDLAESATLGSGGDYAGAVDIAGELRWSSSATQSLSGAVSGSGQLTVEAGQLTLSAASSRSGATSVANGTLVVAHAGALGSGAVSVSAPGTLRLALAPSAPLAFSPVLTGAGTVDVALGGAGVLSLANAGGFTGSIRLSSGVFDPGAFAGNLIFAGGSLAGGFGGYAGSVTVASGSTYALAAQGLPSELGVSAGGTLDFAGATGAALGATVRYSGGTFANAAAFVGTVDVRQSGLTLAAGSLGAGTVLIGSGLSATLGAGFANDVRLEGTGSLTNDLSDFSGTVILGTLADYNLGVDPDFVRAAGFRLADGGRLRGQGATGSLTVESGGVVAPGNSPGVMTVNGDSVLQGGGGYEFEVKSVIGAVSSTPVAGEDYDVMLVTGELDLSALSASSRFLVDLISLDGAGVQGGTLADFDSTASYDFTLIDYGTIRLGDNESLGSDLTSLFLIDSTQFRDGLGAQVLSGWRVINSGSAIVLSYAPIPEPSTYGLMLGGLALVVAAARRRRSPVKS